MAAAAGVSGAASRPYGDLSLKLQGGSGGGGGGGEGGGGGGGGGAVEIGAVEAVSIGGMVLADGGAGGWGSSAEAGAGRAAASSSMRRPWRSPAA